MAHIPDPDFLITGSDNEGERENGLTMANIPDLDSLHIDSNNEGENGQTMANIPDLDSLHTGSDGEASNVQTLANIPDLDSLHTGSGDEASNVQTLANIPDLDSLHTSSDNEMAQVQAMANITDQGSLYIGSDNGEAIDFITSTSVDTETSYNLAVANTNTGSQAPSANTQLATPEHTSSHGNEHVQTTNESRSWLHEDIPVEERSKLYKDLGIVQVRPKIPKYAPKDKRKLSFTHWNGAVQAESLAKAGFYFEGNGDEVRCFYCGNCLRSWRHGDDTWIEHARWFPECQHLILNLGQDFIHAVQELQHDQTDDQCQISFEDVKNRMRQDLSAAKYEHAERKLPVSEDSDEDLDLESDHPTEDLKQLKEVNKRLKDKTVCIRCRRADWNTVVLPCGHIVLCQICAWEIEDCFVCKEPIDTRLIVYL